MNIIDKIVDDGYIDEDFEINNKNSESSIDDDNCCCSQIKFDDDQLPDIRCDDDIQNRCDDDNQIPQTEASSCGKIAIINVLKALNYEFDYDFLNENIKYNKRNKTGTLAQYLFSCSIAGVNANELIENFFLFIHLVMLIFYIGFPIGLKKVLFLSHY
jgi:hypothetical protein